MTLSGSPSMARGAKCMYPPGGPAAHRVLHIVSVSARPILSASWSTSGCGGLCSPCCARAGPCQST
eukprot:1768495-Alexandrium_andersonii.AAC.1